MVKDFRLWLRLVACQRACLTWVIALALPVSGCSRRSAAEFFAYCNGPCVIAQAAQQGKQKLAIEIRRLSEQRKQSPTDKSPKSKNPVASSICSVLVANLASVTDGFEKNIGQTKRNSFLAA